MSRLGKILLMDDDKMVRNIVAEMLKQLGYEVAGARDGVEAINYYKEAYTNDDPFDAVIVDLTIKGGMGGREAIEELLKIDSKIKAVVSSGYTNDPIMDDYGEYGFVGAVSKPFTIEELGEVLENIIDA